MMYEEMMWESFVQLKGGIPDMGSDGRPEDLGVRLDYHYFKGGVEAALHILEAEKEPEWISVDKQLPEEAQEVLFVRGNKVIFGAWIGGIFWSNNQKQAALYWMPLPAPPEHKPEQACTPDYLNEEI